MKHTRTIEVPATQRDQDDGYTCDRCKKRFKHASVAIMSNGVDWEGDQYGVSYTSVSRGSGSNYPECGWATTTEWHICSLCFDTWLDPLLRAECGDGSTEERSW